MENGFIQMKLYLTIHYWVIGRVTMEHIKK